MQAIERHVETLDWITIIFMVSLALLATVRSLYPQRFEEFASLLNSNKFMVFKGKENKAFHPFNILMFIVNVLAVSTFLYLLYTFFIEAKPPKPLVVFIRILTAYMGFVLVKFGIDKIISNIFEFDAQMDYYLFQKLSHRNFISIGILVAAALLIYSLEPTRILIYGLIITILLANLISLFVIYKQNQNTIVSNWFYFILYLCALEIAPYIILYKLFTI
ncbi:DUF4271 domain-containing protein [Salegentibacter chungangensis]|uniref:DUF4271 domain-containing protein n=1 Tax=Salegentibacter chungangensis TaxID=1335724 RepID=A0ABW3NMA0_9FLAO